ncbi:MAG: hypothetical protein R2736_23510 [Solirubrobacterales bacterium]
MPGVDVIHLTAGEVDAIESVPVVTLELRRDLGLDRIAAGRA